MSVRRGHVVGQPEALSCMRLWGFDLGLIKDCVRPIETARDPVVDVTRVEPVQIADEERMPSDSSAISRLSNHP